MMLSDFPHVLTQILLDRAVLNDIVALDAMRKESGLTLGQAVEAARRLVFARTPRGEYELVSLAPAPNGALADLGEAKRVVADALDAVSQLRLPEGSYAEAAA